MSDLSHLSIQSMRERVSRAEWQTRVDLAACYRLVHHYGMDDLVYNHISARVPGEEGHFLINAYGMTYDEVTASSLVKIDFDGNIVLDSGTGYGINRAGFVIHSAVHRGRPGRRLRDPHAYARRHGGLGDGVRPAAAHAERHVLRRRRLSRLRRAGGRPRRAEAAGAPTSAASVAMILRNHGLLTVGATIPRPSSPSTGWNGPARPRFSPIRAESL